MVQTSGHPDPSRVLALAERGMLTRLYADRKPDVTAIVAPRGERTWGQLHANANRIAAALRSAGLKPGDHLSLLCPNAPEFVEVFAAVQRSGYKLTPINWHLSAEEVGYIVRDSTSRAFIAHADFAAIAAEAAPDGLALKLAIGGAIPGFDDYGDALAAQSDADPAEPTIGGTMMYTSGTTGRPKGVFRRKTLVIPPQWGAGSLKGYDMDADVNMCVGPAYHAAPLAFDITQPLMAGVRIALAEKFDPEGFLAAVERYRVTHVHMVSTMFQRMLALPEAVKRKYDLSSLRYVLHGAAPTPPDVKRAMIAWLGPVIHEYYAASEGGGNFFIGPEEWLAKPGSVGRLDPAFGARVVDDDGNPVAPGQVGRIFFAHNPAARFEYFNAPEKTKEAELDDTHFTVGDMGYVDEDGYLFLTGRTAECIISGGVNIYPQEIDNAMILHPAVRDVCTIGAPNTEWGEEVKAVVALNPGFAPSPELAEDLRAFARERLAGFKTPRSVDFVDEIPRSEAGKVQRRAVRAPYWAGRTVQI